MNDVSYFLLKATYHSFSSFTSTKQRPQGVQILSIMIQSCTLPKEIESQMEEKTKAICKNAQQRMFHQNNMQNTRIEEDIITLMQTFEELRHQEESSGAEQINEEKVKLNDAVAEAKKSEAIIIEEGIVRIDKLRAESDLEVQRIISRKVRGSREPCLMLLLFFGLKILITHVIINNRTKQSLP